jgi:hypothetical protein
MLTRFYEKSWMDVTDLFVASTISNQHVMYFWVYNCDCKQGSIECILHGVIIINGLTKSTQIMIQGSYVRFCYFGWENPYFLFVRFFFVIWYTSMSSWIFRLSKLRRDKALVLLTTFFFPGSYSNVTPYSSRIKSQRKTRSEAFKPLKILFLWSVTTIMS